MRKYVLKIKDGVSTCRSRSSEFPSLFKFNRHKRFFQNKWQMHITLQKSTASIYGTQRKAVIVEISQIRQIINIS